MYLTKSLMKLQQSSPFTGQSIAEWIQVTISSLKGDLLAAIPPEVAYELIYDDVYALKLFTLAQVSQPSNASNSILFIIIFQY